MFGNQVPAGAGNFSLHHCVHTGSGTHTAPIQWVPGALFLVVKWPGCEADYSPPSSTENVWSYSSTSPICLHGVVLSWITRTTSPLPYHFNLSSYPEIKNLNLHYLNMPCYVGLCHHSMAQPHVKDGRESLKIWKVAVNILNMQLPTADKRWPSSFRVWWWADNSSL